MAQPTLTRDQMTALNNMERQLNDSLTTLDKLEDCGQDCSAMKGLIAESLQRSAKLRQHFAPKNRLS